jgi:quercetin dioxygenase-like cupin family protein
MSSPSAAPEAALHRWSDTRVEAINPLLDRQFVTGERVMLARMHLKPGCVVPRHSHDNEQVTCVLEGCLRLTLGDDDSRTHELRPGDILIIPANIPHKAEALEDTYVLDVFGPPRADWLDGTDAYLRR